MGFIHGSYTKSLEGYEVWQHRADPALDDDYQSLSWALNKSLLTGDYSIFELTSALFRSKIMALSEEKGSLVAMPAIQRQYFPGHRVLKGAFEPAVIALIGSKWLMAAGPLSPETEPDIVWDEPRTQYDFDGDPVYPDPGFFGVTWQQVGDGQTTQMIEQSMEPKFDVLQIELAAAGMGDMREHWLPLINETCGAPFADYLTYIIFNRNLDHFIGPIRHQNPEVVWSKLSPVVRIAMGLVDNPYQTTINRHFLA